MAERIRCRLQTFVRTCAAMLQVCCRCAAGVLQSCCMLAAVVLHAGVHAVVLSPSKVLTNIP